MERCLSQAHTLRYHYPETLAQIEQGRVSAQHARVITDAGIVIGTSPDPDTLFRRSAYEEAVLDIAAETTPARLRPIARRLAERYAGRGIDERHRLARCERRVYVLDGADGMADLIAHLPAVEAHAIHARLTALSRRETSGSAGEGSDVGPEARSTAASAATPARTRDEMRADLFAEMLLGDSPAEDEGAGSASTTGSSAGTASTARISGVRAQVQVVIPVNLLGTATTDLMSTAASMLSAGQASSRDPVDLGMPAHGPVAELAGHGPIDTASARELAGTARTWRLVHVDATTGTVLSVDRYRPSEAMRRHLVARDQHCRFPGCRVSTARCDIDHTIDAQHGGETSTRNLAHLCRGHHTMRHHGGWKAAQNTIGTLTWVSPTGRVHREPPPSRVAFTPETYSPEVLLSAGMPGPKPDPGEPARRGGPVDPEPALRTPPRAPDRALLQEVHRQRVVSLA